MKPIKIEQPARRGKSDLEGDRRQKFLHQPTRCTRIFWAQSMNRIIVKRTNKPSFAFQTGMITAWHPGFLLRSRCDTELSNVKENRF